MRQIFSRIKDLVKSNIPDAPKNSAEILEEELRQMKKRLSLDENGVKPQKRNYVQSNGTAGRVQYSNTYLVYYHGMDINKKNQHIKNVKENNKML